MLRVILSHPSTLDHMDHVCCHSFGTDPRGDRPHCMAECRCNYCVVHHGWYYCLNGIGMGIVGVTRVIPGNGYCVDHGVGYHPPTKKPHCVRNAQDSEGVLHYDSTFEAIQ
eukprot:PhF_6_TR26636/c0_g1_i1/m.38572